MIAATYARRGEPEPAQTISAPIATVNAYAPKGRLEASAPLSKDLKAQLEANIGQFALRKTTAVPDADVRKDLKSSVVADAETFEDVQFRPKDGLKSQQSEKTKGADIKEKSASGTPTMSRSHSLRSLNQTSAPSPDENKEAVPEFVKMREKLRRVTGSGTNSPMGSQEFQIDKTTNGSRSSLAIQSPAGSYVATNAKPTSLKKDQSLEDAFKNLKSANRPRALPDSNASGDSTPKFRDALRSANSKSSLAEVEKIF